MRVHGQHLVSGGSNSITNYLSDFDWPSNYRRCDIDEATMRYILPCTMIFLNKLNSGHLSIVPPALLHFSLNTAIPSISLSISVWDLLKQGLH